MMSSSSSSSEKDTWKDLARLAQALGFDTTESLNEWIESLLFEPYWKQYKQGFIDKQPKGKGRSKGPEFKHVVKQIAAGESGGKRLYST